MSVVLFAILGKHQVCWTDEATHGVNAYEMLKNGNVWINTLRYEVDYYNSKPPLMLWLIILGYKIFGFTPMGLRFFSAVAGLLVFIIAFIFVYRNRGKAQALVFAAFFPACSLLFEYHGFRAGDMDGVYTLIYLSAMVCLYKAVDKLEYLFGYGVFLGLGFMCKATHISTMLGIGILFAPYLIYKYGIKKAVYRYLLSYITAGIVILPWAIVRFRFDGLNFFYKIFMGETVGRVQGNAANSIINYFSYLIQIIKEPICAIAIVMIVVAVVIKIAEIKSGTTSKEVLMGFISDSYIVLMSMWFVVVVGLYSITKSEMEWYIYSAYIPLLILGAEAYVYLEKRLLKKGNNISRIILFSACIFLTVSFVRVYPWNGSGGSPLIGLQDTILGMEEVNSEEAKGKVAYIENSQNVLFERNRWEHDYMFYASTMLDVVCKDGGVPLFLEEENQDAILILDKKLWDEYSSVLTGYVILADNEYLVFSKRRYGE